MALHVQASFASGELDPALFERTSLDKYSSGLAAARNVLVAKTGRLVSRAGREIIWTTKLANTKCILYSPPYTGITLEWGHLYVRAYANNANNIYSATDKTMIGEWTHPLTEADLPNIRFESTQFYVYIFCAGKVPLKLLPAPTGGGFIANAFSIPSAPGTGTAGTTSGATAPTGYPVDYYVTYVQNGQESLGLAYTTSSVKLPSAGGESNTITADLPSAVTLASVTEMRVYRRPHLAGAYGYIGSSSALVSVSGPPIHVVGTFNDIGQTADYTHTPPTIIPSMINRIPAGSFNDPHDFLPSVGTIFQQRLLLTDYLNPEAIVASRTGYQNNFYDDHPLSDDSSLLFKSGSSGFAKILALIESDGLIVFTTSGIFVHQGALTVDNLALEKKGNWVIDTALPPITVPGGVVFLDSLTNTVRVLAYSTELATYTGAELSIFSDHLFLGRKIVSWAFQDGETPVLWAVFNDGQFASFTYEPTQQMRAWTRSDSSSPVEWVSGTGVGGTTLFLSNNNGTRYVERTLPRYAKIADILVNPETDKSNVIAFMDGVTTPVPGYLMTTSVTGPITITPVTAGVWDGPLTFTFAPPIPGNGGFYLVTPGMIFRWFSPVDGTSIDFTVASVASNDVAILNPSTAFPSAYATAPRVYRTFKTVSITIDQATPLIGKPLSVIVDGYVVSSPNNDKENYPTSTLVPNYDPSPPNLLLNYTLTLPSNLSGAIIHIGTPITADVGTLDLDTVEQRPILIESKTVNKVYMKLHRTRGLFAGNAFTANDKITTMQELDTFDVNYTLNPGGLVLGNHYSPPKTTRLEISIPGDWKSNGRICVRQVDPLHFEILSIIPDVEDERRR